MSLESTLAEQIEPPASAAPVPGRERALLLADNFGIFLAVARSLGRIGVEVDVVPADPGDPGLRSRYVRALRTLPCYRDGAASWVRGIRELIEDRDYRLVVPCSDDMLLLLDHHRDEIGPGRLALPGRRALAVLTDKMATRSLAERTGVPVARGEAIGSGTDPAAIAARLGLPMVLKPRRSYRIGSSHGKERPEIVRDPGSLQRTLARIGSEEWFAESFFPGEGVGVSVFARAGRLVLAWQHRRLLEVSDTGASSARIGERPDPVLVGHVGRLAEAAGLDGVAMFEFRRDPESGAHVLLECNPRFWGSLPLALAGGADFPALLWKAASGRDLALTVAPRSGTVRRSMSGEFYRIANRIEAASSPFGRIAAAAALVGLAASLPIRSRFDSWAADDPEPWRAERRQLARRIFAALRNRLISRAR